MRRSTAMSALAVTVVAAGAMVALANSGSAAPAVQSSVQSNALSGNWYGAAPYVMPLDNTPPDLSQVMAATGQKSFELAFVLDGGGCSAAWDGTAAVSSDTTVANVINGVRASGGDVSVSFGGFGGTKLGKGGLARAYAAATRQAVAALPILDRIPVVHLAVAVPYDRLGAAKRLLRPPQVELAAEEYGAEVRLVLRVHEEREPALLAALAELGARRIE